MRFGKSSTHEKFGNCGKDEISEAVRKATNKHLTRPDVALNQKVVSAINNTPSSDIDGHQIASILVGRMRDPNPHKQWLTIMVAQRVMRDCKERLGESTSEILLEVSSIAARPIGTTVVNASGAQKAKQEAFMLLQEHGQEGQDAMRQTGGDAAANLLVNEQATANGAYMQPDKYTSPGVSAAAAMRAARWADTKESISAQVKTAQNQTDVLNDMVKNFKTGLGVADKSLLEEMTAQMVNFRMHFEGQMAQLTLFQTDEANKLLAEAIDTVERMNGALESYHETMTAACPADAPASQQRQQELVSLIDMRDDNVTPEPPAVELPTQQSAMITLPPSSIVDPFAPPPAVAAQQLQQLQQGSGPVVQLSPTLNAVAVSAPIDPSVGMPQPNLGGMPLASKGRTPSGNPFGDVDLQDYMMPQPSGFSSSTPDAFSSSVQVGSNGLVSHRSILPQQQSFNTIALCNSFASAHSTVSASWGQAVTSDMTPGPPQALVSQPHTQHPAAGLPLGIGSSAPITSTMHVSHLANSAWESKPQQGLNAPRQQLTGGPAAVPGSAATASANPFASPRAPIQRVSAAGSLSFSAGHQVQAASEASRLSMMSLNNPSSSSTVTPSPLAALDPLAAPQPQAPSKVDQQPMRPAYAMSSSAGAAAYVTLVSPQHKGLNTAAAPMQHDAFQELLNNRR